MTSTIRCFISDRSGREFALNMDHVISMKPGAKPGTVEATLVGSTMIIQGDLRQILAHVAHGTAMTEAPGQGSAEFKRPDEVKRDGPLA